jgi:hypothetical protein
MQNDLFKYALRRINPLTSTYVYYYLDANNVVQTSSTKRYLNYSPEGWEEQSLKWERGTNYYGVFTNYTNPLRFVKDGRKILKTLFYNNGIGFQLELLIDKHSNEVATWGYNQYYVGDIDFSRFKDEKDFTQVEIMEQGFMSKLKANEDTKYEIGLGTGVWVRMDGYPLQGQAEWQTGVNVNASPLPVAATEEYPILAYVPPNNGYNPYFAFVTQSPFNTIDDKITLFKNTSQNVDVYVTLSYDYYVNLFIDSSALSPAYFGIQGRVFNSAGTVIQTLNLYVHPTAQTQGTSQTYLGSISQPLTIPSGCYFSLSYIAWITPTSVKMSANNYQTTDVITGSKLTANWSVKVPTTYVKCLPAFDLGTLITQKIDANSNFSSDVASNNLGYMLTSGDSLRNLTGAVIKTSMSDYFKGMNCMFNSALWYDKSSETLHIDDKAVVFDSLTTAVNIGEVASFQIEPYLAEQFSVVKFGYKPYEYDTINGKEEFNQDTTFNTPLERIQGSKDFISPYRADRYGIELVRANLADKTNADSDNDNDIFWINVDLASGVQGTIPAGYAGAGQNFYQLYRDSNMSYVQGVEFGSDCYNTEFSPKRRMYAFGKYLRGCLNMYASSNLTFANQSKTQNGNLSVITDDSLKLYDEMSNEIISDLAPSGYFLPYLMTIEVKIPVNLQEIFDVSGASFGVVEFTYKGNTYEGFIIEATDSPTYRPKQTFKLLAKFGTNLTTLINGI